MKHLLLFALWITAAVAQCFAGAVTLDSLIGCEFSVEDHWAGEEFVLKKEGKNIYAIWRILGLGVPVVSETRHVVEVRSPNQCVFFLNPKEKRSEVNVSLDSDGEVRVYLDGIRIYIREIRPNQ